MAEDTHPWIRKEFPTKQPADEIERKAREKGQEVRRERSVDGWWVVYVR